MFNLQPFVGKTIREIQRRQGGEQIIIYFEDESFLIVTADSRGVGNWGVGKAIAELTFQGRAIEK